MSADISTSAPRHGVPAPAVAPDRRVATVDARRGRLALDDEEMRSALLVSPAGSEAALTWAQDSTGLRRFVRPQPRLRQIIGVCGWAALLGVLGLAVGIRGFIADLMDATPSWYEPMMIGVGLVGIALTVGAFVSVHRRRTPYLLLSAATVVLAYAIFLTGSAL
ncbi:MAG TPA: hypothetical protein VH561_18320 [Micromonosporaceae bacterium]|jgi:hypothetical protein